MNSYRKVDTSQFFSFWRNLSISLLAIIITIALTKLLPFYFSPIVALIVAGGLYTLIYQDGAKKSGGCMVVPFVMFYVLMNYCIVSVVINVGYVWGVWNMPEELIFFSNPYLPALILMPVGAVTTYVMYLRRRHLNMCRECKASSGTSMEQGVFGRIATIETYVQLRNLTFIFLGLTVILWCYYELIYINTTVSKRDWYVFLWLVIITFFIDEIYFIFRYYNLYLDLEEGDEIITADEIEDMTAKTYVRFYVICGNDIYLDPHCIDPDMAYREVIDTPFVIKRNVNGMTVADLRKSVENLTQTKDGELRFFFGRRLNVGKNQSLIRYFYFLDGKPEDYENIKVQGRWIDFDKVKQIYSRNPGALAPVFLSDITRLATIMLTQKTFDERGFRRLKIKKYKPGFNLPEVRLGNLDFQDDKWINISMFNSDTPFYRFRRWWRMISGRNYNQDRQWD